jgi:Lrp/AsnC family leucine-responsive transcriptional regulator
VAFIHVHTSGNGTDKAILKSLAALPQVQEIHYVSGDDSYLLKVRETDTKALGRLVREQIAPLGGVVATRTAIVMNTFKETARIPIDDQALNR